MDDFIKRQGLPFLSHVLGRVQCMLIRGYEEWMPEAGFRAPPRTHSTLQAIHQHGPLGVTQIAGLTRQSHPLVIRWVRQLKERGLLEAVQDPLDGRRTALTLTKAGKAEVQAQEVARKVIAQMLQRLVAEADADVYEALWRIEEACRREPVGERLRRASRESRTQTNDEKARPLCRGGPVSEDVRSN